MRPLPLLCVFTTICTCSFALVKVSLGSQVPGKCLGRRELCVEFPNRLTPLLSPNLGKSCGTHRGKNPLWKKRAPVSIACQV